MKKVVCFSLGLLLALAGASQLTAQPGGATVTVVPGYVIHGVNAFNDEPVVDYSQASPTVVWLAADPLIKEIGVLAEDGAGDAEVITADTDRSRPVATIKSFAEFFNPGGTDPSLYNRTLDQIGSNFFGFTDLSQRILPVSFEDAVPGDLYRVRGANARPTVGEWDAMSGQMRITCREDGTASADVTVRNAFPHALYTLWDVGALDPLTPQERGYAAPFGGLPNVLFTDGNGCGHRVIELAFCPNRPCVGNTSCTSYVSAFYHWDGQAYGGSPAGTFAGAPVGAVAGNQLAWPMAGTPIIPPQNTFSAQSAGCAANR